MAELISNLRRRFEPAITPMFRAWWRFSRSMTLGAFVVAEDEAGRVMLVRQTYRAGWSFPGGGVERGETALEAARRELAEEAGLEMLAPPALVGLYAHPQFRGDHIALFHSRAFRPCASDSAGEIAERRFFARGETPEDLWPSARRRLNELFDGAPQAEWW